MGIQRPGLLFLPDLPSSPFVPRDAQRHDVELLQSSFPAILRDFGAVSWDFSGTTPLPRGWSPPLAPGPGQPNWKKLILPLKCQKQNVPSAHSAGCLHAAVFQRTC